MSLIKLVVRTHYASEDKFFKGFTWTVSDMSFLNLPQTRHAAACEHICLMRPIKIMTTWLSEPAIKLSKGHN